MENVLVAFLIIFILLFGVLTFSETLMSTQDALSQAWQAMQARQDEQARTSLVPVEAHTETLGTVAEFTLTNTGMARLTDFQHWDAFLMYTDAGTPPENHTLRLSYVTQAPNGGQWTVAGIYLNARPEMVEPGILNPGEDMVLQLRGTVPMGEGTGAQVVMTTANGVDVSFAFMTNVYPVLETNTGLVLAEGSSATISRSVLAVSDADDPAADLLYSVTIPPAQGELNLGTMFTQADIDMGQLMYTHTGTGPDAFQFTVSDGKDSIGPFIFAITPSAPPELVLNTGLTMLAGSTVTIDSAQLQVTDSDDAPEDLVYSVITPPKQGQLNLGASFTQADLDEDSLQYNHTGLGDDSFQFVVSDGESVIGPYNMIIWAH